MEAKAAVGEGCEQSGRIVTKENISILFIFCHNCPSSGAVARQNCVLYKTKITMDRLRKRCPARGLQVI